MNLSLSGFGGGEISAQSKPGDEGPPASSSTGVAYAGSVVECTTFAADPLCSNLHAGGCVLLHPLAPTPGLHSLDIASNL